MGVDSMKTPEDEAFDDLAKRQGDWGGGYPAKKAMAADKLQEPVTEREALEIALDYVLRTTYWTEGRDRHDTLKAIKEALAQPWPDLTKRDRESYQKGHNDGVAHHKKSVKAAQPAQEPVCDKDPQGCWNVRCQLGKQCKNLAQPAQPQQDESDLITIAYQSGFYDGKKAALAQPAQEPVALVIDGVLVKSALPEKYTGHLYTTPPQREWVGLTIYEMDEAFDESMKVRPKDASNAETRRLFARATEAKLKEKNT